MAALIKPCPRCKAHGAATKADGSLWCLFPPDEEIVGALVKGIVEEFSTRDAQRLVSIFATRGAEVALDLHEALNAPKGD